MIGEVAPGSRAGIAERPNGDGGSIEDRLRRAGLPGLRRLAWLEVDLAILEANARVIRTLLPRSTRFGVVVKAAGYGHGIVAAGRAAVVAGADVLLVATLDEALALRSAGLRGRVLVLYPVPRAAIEDAVHADVETAVADEGSLRDLLESAAALATGRRRRVKVHLAVDTGMARTGFSPDAVAAAAATLIDARAVDVVGAWSHLRSPEAREVVDGQVAQFERALASLRPPAQRLETHLAATGGLLGTAPLYDLVRVGLAFYGLIPPELAVSPRARAAAASLRPALTLKARPVSVATIPAGAEVGYGGTWRAERESTIATLPIGYADGWSRLYSPGASALVRGVRAPIVGRVSSDAVAVDVTDLPGTTLADEFVLIGSQGAERIDPVELAGLRRSIAWEVLDALGDRLARVYARHGAAVAILPPGGVMVEAGSSGAGWASAGRRNREAFAELMS